MLDISKMFIWETSSGRRRKESERASERKSARGLRNERKTERHKEEGASHVTQGLCTKSIMIQMTGMIMWKIRATHQET